MKKNTFAALAAACLVSFTLGFAVTASEAPAADPFDQELEGQSSFAAGAAAPAADEAAPAEGEMKCDQHQHGKDGKPAEGHSCSKEHAEKCGECCKPGKDGEEAKCGECCKDGKCGECCGKDGKHDGHGPGGSAHHDHGKQGGHGEHGGHGGHGGNHG
jgi:hypothetical protein